MKRLMLTFFFKPGLKCLLLKYKCVLVFSAAVVLAPIRSFLRQFKVLCNFLS